MLKSPNRTHITCVVLTVVAIPAPIPVAAAPVATVEEFTRLENEWNTAVLNKDAKTVQRSQ